MQIVIRSLVLFILLSQLILFRYIHGDSTTSSLIILSSQWSLPESSGRHPKYVYWLCQDLRFLQILECACKVQGIDYSSVSDYTNDAALVQNVTLYDIEPPSIILDDCSVSVQCPDQYSLVVLDTDSYRMVCWIHVIMD